MSISPVRFALSLGVTASLGALVLGTSMSSPRLSSDHVAAPLALAGPTSHAKTPANHSKHAATVTAPQVAAKAKGATGSSGRSLTPTGTYNGSPQTCHRLRVQQPCQSDQGGRVVAGGRRRCELDLWLEPD